MIRHRLPRAIVDANKMMPGGRFKDLSGDIIGRLTLLKPSGAGLSNGTRWLSLCECGRSMFVAARSLENGDTKSCGCLRAETCRVNMTTHGGTGTRLHGIWENMLYRCRNPKYTGWKDYGGRGISVCDEWSRYEPFRGWALGNGYADELTIDRIDNDGNYNPKNCKWSTCLEQGSNKRNNIYHEIDGDVKTITCWARMFNIKPKIVFGRIYRGWTHNEALELQPRNKGKLYGK